MGNRWGLGCIALLLLMLAGCSQQDETADETLAEPTPATAAEACQAGAERIVDRFQTFVASLGDVTFEEFLAQDEVAGLDVFQTDVAAEITETANESSTLCSLDGLQGLVNQELAAVENPDLLTSYLISNILEGGQVERQDVMLGPDSDFAAILPLLADGSSITLEPGIYEFESALLVQQRLLLVGSGMSETIVNSPAEDAAIAVFGTGSLTLRDLTIAHTGDAAASVILALGAPVDIERVRLEGARGEEESGGGSGLLLNDGVIDENGEAGARPEGSEAPGESRIIDSEIVGNDIAGITVTGALQPEIRGNLLSENGACGLCLVGQSGGVIEGNRVAENEFGMQVGDQAKPRIVANTVESNLTAGVVLLGSSTPFLEKNDLIDNGEVGFAIQEQASPELQNNTVSGSHVIGMTIVDAAIPLVFGSRIGGADVALQVAGTAQPTIEDTIFTSTEVGVVFREMSAGIFRNNRIDDVASLGLLIEGEAKPAIDALTVIGAEVDVSYREQAGGTLENSVFDAPNIAAQVEDSASPRIANNQVNSPRGAAFVVRSDGPVEVIGNTIELDEGGLAIGLAGAAGATISSNVVTGGATAVSAVEQSAGLIEGNIFEGQDVAIQIAESATSVVRDNRIVDAATVGIVARDDAAPLIEDNLIANPREIGVQVVGLATPEIIGNVLVVGLDLASLGATEGSAGATGGSSGAANGDPSEGLGASGEGSVAADSEDAVDGEEDPEATVGILYAEEGEGLVSGNELIGFVIAVQVGDTASPIFDANVIDGGRARGVAFLYRGDAAGVAMNNETSSHSVGFQIGDNAKPELTANRITRVSDAAFLVQGDATPSIQRNICPAGVPGIGVLDGAKPVVGDNECAQVAG